MMKIDPVRRLLLLCGLGLPFQALARGKGTAAKLDLSGFADTVVPDVQYSPVSNSTVMDIYIPKATVLPPIVMWVHGGAFWGGDKRDSAPLKLALPNLMAAGIAVAAVDYRLSGEAIWPAQREDLANALSFLRDHAADYGYDPSRLAVFGSSAGATLALIAGMDEAAAKRGTLKAIAAWFPATLFPEMDNDMSMDFQVPQGQLMARKGSMISKLVGVAVGMDPTPALRASPVTLLGELPQDVALPPFLLAAGQDDTTISWRQSKRMADALAERSSPPSVDYTIYPNSGHGSGAFDGEAMPHLVGFLADHLSAK